MAHVTAVDPDAPEDPPGYLGGSLVHTGGLA